MSKKASWIVLLIVMLLMAACSQDTGGSSSAGDEITIGIITDLSGPGATLGPAAVNAAELAVEEINNAGGLLGKKVNLIVGDGASDPQTSNEQARNIYERNHADALFLMSNSANREAIMPTAEQSGKLFFYTPIYEGGAFGENMYFSGEVPSQQIEPVIPHLIKNYGATKWYIVANDYVWATKTSEVLKEMLAEEGAEIVGEDYVPFGTSEFSSIIARIQDAEPNFISLQVVGSDAISFVTQLHSMGMSDLGLFGYNIDEDSIRTMGEAAVGLLQAASYFHNLDTPENKDYLERYYKKFGEDAPSPNFVSNSPYEAIHLWAKAVEKAGSVETEKVNETITTVSFTGPKGEVSYDLETHHASLPIYLGEVQSDFEIKIVHEFGIIDP